MLRKDHWLNTPANTYKGFALIIAMELVAMLLLFIIWWNT